MHVGLEHLVRLEIWQKPSQRRPVGSRHIFRSTGKDITGLSLSKACPGCCAGNKQASDRRKLRATNRESSRNIIEEIKQ